MLVYDAGLLGIELKRLQDAYTDAGVHDGSTPQPPTLSPPSPLAGGRPSNGKVWVEYLAET